MMLHGNHQARLRSVLVSPIIASERGDLVCHVPYERLLTDNLSTIRALSSRMAWRGGLSPDDIDDFCSHVVEKLLDRDYEILRQFQGRSSLPTYLAVVIQRLFQDYRNHLWGKWRPSMEARRQGPLAIRLEQLLVRDGLTLNEAFATMDGSGASIDRQNLERIAQALPVRVGRQFAGDDVLEHVPDGSPGAEDRAIANGLRSGAERIRAALDDALATLPDEDASLIRLCFWEHMSIAAVARALAVPQKPLYRRIERTLDQLRRALGAAGLHAEARALLDHLWSDFLDPPKVPANNGGGIDGARSSNGNEVTGARG
jgi:RNA polymerase sigma factor (sigma-70 family)